MAARSRPQEVVHMTDGSGGSKVLYRPRNDRMVGGVCAGLANYIGMDVTLMRVLYVLVSVLSAAFPGILVYIVLWIVIPEEPA